MWHRKKTQYHHHTSASVSFFQIKKIYCVSFLSTCRWFETPEEAEQYKSFLYQEFFFSFDFVCEGSEVTIKEYCVPDLFGA